MVVLPHLPSPAAGEPGLLKWLEPHGEPSRPDGREDEEEEVEQAGHGEGHFEYVLDRNGRSGRRGMRVGCVLDDGSGRVC